MTAIEQAIGDAVEKGGYDAERNRYDYYSKTDNGEGEYDYNKIFLDPAFWRALGKARGWSDTYHADWKGDYKYHWHRFINHLAEGGEAEQFFKNLV